MSEDMTYCFFSKCPNKKCERHISHIKQHYIPHSFGFFTECVWWELPTKYIVPSGEKRGEVDGKN